MLSKHLWKTLSSKMILDHSKYLMVENRTIQLPDGRVIENWPWVVTPDFVNVVAVAVDGRFLCFRQTKYALSGLSLALVGGFIDKGESPIQAVKRELLEETGYEAPEWVDLGSFRVDPNRGMAIGNLFLARGAVQVAKPTSDDLEEQELLMLSRNDIETALDRGEFKVLAWATAVALALRHMQAKCP
ncbi:MAG: NUDIX hydrolase [Kiritimatiellae bacterium]|nr:NUDIX hydrolase [Kiritimatiellia bacterium]MDD5522191.1 NUDIX hydrolase [Kiritimatiellia bacterium]